MDFDNDDFLEFNDFHEGEDDRIKQYKKAQRLMFINDVERFPSQPMPLNLIEFIELFDNPSSEDKHILTQAFMRDYLTIDIDSDREVGDLVAKWGLDWLEMFLDYNVEVEEYELCSIIRDVIKVGGKQLKAWMNENR